MKEMRRLLAEWPGSIPCEGLMLTTFGESLPFVSYKLQGDLLIVERKTPDAQGGRRVIMSIECIVAIKILDAIDMARFTAMGFQ
jgi:hypothetical protein